MTTDTQKQYVEEQDYDSQPMDENELYEPYRSLSKAAAISLTVAFLALLGLLFPAMLSLAVVAIALGFVALRNLRRYPAELTGRMVALAGISLGMLLLIGGSILHTIIYMTEVPPGYERISFEQLQPSEVLHPDNPKGLPLELDGKQVFVKGYVHPGVSDMGEIKKFILVPDMGTCCFGGQPKMTDMIEVTITGPRGVRYAPRKRKLAGVFHVHSHIRNVAGGLQGGLFELDADYVR